MLTSIILKKNRCYVIHKLKLQTLFPPTHLVLQILSPSPTRPSLSPFTTLQFATFHRRLLLTISRYVSPLTPLNLQLLKELGFITTVSSSILWSLTSAIKVHGCFFSHFEHYLDFWKLLWASVEVHGCFFSDCEHIGLLKTLLSIPWSQKVWILFIIHSKIQFQFFVWLGCWECCSLRFHWEYFSINPILPHFSILFFTIWLIIGTLIIKFKCCFCCCLL